MSSKVTIPLPLGLSSKDNDSSAQPYNEKADNEQMIKENNTLTKSLSPEKREIQRGVASGMRRLRRT